MIDTRSGFHPHASGLLVPEDVAREREVWTRDEWKALEKVTKFLQGKGVELFMGCTHHDCKKLPIERIRRADGGLTLRCAHKDREIIPRI